MVNNCINFIEETGQYRFRFLNGEIILPNKPGGYVMATGCGSGKTTAIKKLMTTKFYEGILYSAATIDECDSMYDFLINECRLYGGSINVNDRGFTYSLTPDRIINIHSSPRIEKDMNGNSYVTNGINTNLWRNHPEKVADFYIVICTHAKLLHENPLTLMSTSFLMNPRTNLLVQAMSGYDKVKLPRQWMLIDELPTCDPLRHSFTKSDLGVAGRCVMNYTITGFDQNNHPIRQYWMSSNPSSDFEEFRQSLLFAINGRHSFGDLNIPSNILKFDLIASVLQNDFNEYFNRNQTSVEVIYNLSDFIINGMNTKMILFDGTGDLTQINSSKFKILTYQNKYNSPINVFKFESHLNRIVKVDKTFSEKVDIFNSLNENVAELQNIINQNEKTLIVTWKNLKSDDTKITSSGSKSSIAKFILDEEFSLTEYYRDRLIAKNGREFDIIHYQSGKDKAVNDYRDYDSIVFLGEFHIPNNVIKEFNELYGCSTDLKNYTTYQLVQAICRTRIRKHNGESINVYFSSDWNNGIIDRVIDYLSNDRINLPIIKDTTLDKIQPKWKDKVGKLMTYSQEFKEAIENNTNLNLDIELDEIYNLIPMNEKKVKCYNAFIKYLNKLGIELNIIAIRKGNQYTIKSGRGEIY